MSTIENESQRSGCGSRLIQKSGFQSRITCWAWRSLRSRSILVLLWCKAQVLTKRYNLETLLGIRKGGMSKMTNARKYHQTPNHFANKYTDGWMDGWMESGNVRKVEK